MCWLRGNFNLGGQHGMCGTLFCIPSNKELLNQLGVESFDSFSQLFFRVVAVMLIKLHPRIFQDSEVL